MVMAHSALKTEDDWTSLYFTASNTTNLILQPPFEPITLLNLTQTNNTLNQCIEAMEVNIDGTGYDFVAAVGVEKMDPKEEASARSLFDEPYPNTSFIKIRRRLRRQVESVGYGFLEVLRNMKDEIVGFRNIETSGVRFVKLDAPIQVQRTVTRNGEEVPLTLWERERRFAQRIHMSTLIYYREFGSTRHVNRSTGEWESDTNKVDPKDRGTELLVFGVHPDNATPYFLPRWINQMPSVVGSRKAEEQNLEFLDSGGLPPAIIFVQGGTLSKEFSDQLKNYLSGKNKNKYRAVVVEAVSSSGSLDAAGAVKVTTERFGSESAKDAMYTTYDASSEAHIRGGFRMPPLFLGKPEDYNFASAVTAYMVAEEQVFQPERGDFDEVINKTLIKALGYKTVRLKSNQITLKDAASQITALQLAKGVATNDSLLNEINTVTGMDLDLDKNPAPSPEALSLAPPPDPIQEGVTRPMGKSAMDLVNLAEDYISASGLVSKGMYSPERMVEVRKAVEELTPEDRKALHNILAQYAYGEPTLWKLVQ
jgi:PBSX family phage portal protein